MSVSWATREWLKAIAIVTACGTACFPLYEWGQLGREARKYAGGLTSQASVSLAQFNATEKDSSAKLAADEKQFGETVTALKHIIERADERLYGKDLKSGLFGQAETILGNGNALLLDTDAAMKQAAKTLISAADDLHSTLEELRPSLQSLAKALGNPAIDATLLNLQEASANLAADTAQLEAMLKSATATAQDVQRVADKVAEEYTKTRNLAYALFKELLGISSEGVQFFLRR